MNARVPQAATLFAGAGGACIGMEAAGARVCVAINHNPVAIASHAANHPGCEHFTEDIFKAQPWKVWPQRPVDLLWASPSCTHFSRAKGGGKVNPQLRSHADVIHDWIAYCAPRLLVLENVWEFTGWGPVYPEGHPKEGMPIPERKGELFNEFVARLRFNGYRVDWRSLAACDYGAPTSRRRLYLVARRDGKAPAWPEPTHGPGRLPYRVAAECIDFTDLGRSIFTRAKPLADATLRRIAAGLIRFVAKTPEPFIVVNTTGNPPVSLREPLKTITTGGHHLLCVPWLLNLSHGGRPEALCEPFRTLTATPKRGDRMLVVPWLVKNFTGAVGSSMSSPIGTITAIDHHSLAVAHLDPDAMRAGGPFAPADRRDEVQAFLAKHGGKAGADEAIRARLACVGDITLRMLKASELALGQGFPEDYQLIGTQAQRIAQIGNAVCPPVAEAITRANL